METNIKESGPFTEEHVVSFSILAHLRLDFSLSRLTVGNFSI